MFKHPNQINTSNGRMRKKQGSKCDTGEKLEQVRDIKHKLLFIVEYCIYMYIYIYIYK